MRLPGMAVQTLLMSELEKQEERLTPRGAAAQMEAQIEAKEKGKKQNIAWETLQKRWPEVLFC